jgi:hypothetical protein
MTGHPRNYTDSPWRFEAESARPAQPHEGLLSGLTQLDALQGAYAQLREAPAMESPVHGSEPPLAGAEVDGFLQQLSEDLRAGTFRVQGSTLRPDADKVSAQEARTDLRIRIVRIAVADALQRVFPTDPPANPVAWTAATIGKGLARVYAVTIDAGKADGSEHILAVVRQHVADPAFLGLLGDILKSIDFPEGAGPNPFASVLTRIAMHTIDQVLQQANLLGRQGSYVHATCIRFGHEVALFLDNDSQYDWLLPAVQKRLREALAEIKAEVDPEKTQWVDLARGDKLHFLEHEFRLIKDRDGTARVQHKRLVKRVVKAPAPKPPPEKRSRQFRFPKVPLRVYAITAGVLLVAAVLVQVVPMLVSHGPRLYPVHGQVFYERKPVAGALVVFLPQDPTDPQAHVASALVAEDGSYVLGTHKPKDGALAGEYVVVIWEPRVLDRLPARYSSRQTTPFTAIVETGPTEVPTLQLQAESP